MSGAQEEADDKGIADDKSVKFTAIALSDLPYENIYYRNGEEFTRIEVRAEKRSLSYSLSKAELLEVFTDDDDPELPYRIIGRAPLVIGTRDILYFFKQKGSDSETTLPLVLYGIDDSEAAFPKSSFRFINFIKMPLALEFNNKRFGIKAGGVTVRKLELSGSGSFTPFIVRDSKGTVLGGTRLFSHAANREMVIIFPPKKGRKRLDIRYFPD